MKKIFAPSQDQIPTKHDEHTEKILNTAQKNIKYVAEKYTIQ